MEQGGYTELWVMKVRKVFNSLDRERRGEPYHISHSTHNQGGGTLIYPVLRSSSSVKVKV